ncbi:hypothetical protein QBC47DRAFT_200453 [Echria macrotheca]|uniref:Uncharacterized protein n=1 Tax=Echria macrotheca TaxID=438768 RepID=A0AAJ0BCU4_9PEZI|nr:hypothetical protein QBC47DRAFT_200453 [Echria macrotheca]
MPRLPRSSSFSDDGGNESDFYDLTRRRANPSPPVSNRRRAASLVAGRHPGLNKQHSYHRPSPRTKKRNPYIPTTSDESESESDSDRDGYHGNRRAIAHRPSRSGSRPRDNRRGDSPDRHGHRQSSRSRPVDYYDVDAVDHGRGRGRHPDPPSYHDDGHRNRNRDDEGSSSRSPSRSPSPRSSRRAASRSSRSKPKGYYPPSSSRPRNNAAHHHHRSSSSASQRERDHQKQQQQQQGSRRRASSEIFRSASKIALEAAAATALKVHSHPGPWLGPKGAKVAAAALSAAAVDTYLEQRHPKRKGGMRHVVMRRGLQAVIGGLVGPVIMNAGGERKREGMRKGYRDEFRGGRMQEDFMDAVKGGMKDGAKNRAKEKMSEGMAGMHRH